MRTYYFDLHSLNIILKRMEIKMCVKITKICHLRKKDLK